MCTANIEELRQAVDIIKGIFQARVCIHHVKTLLHVVTNPKVFCVQLFLWPTPDLSVTLFSHNAQEPGVSRSIKIVAVTPKLQRFIRNSR